MLKLLDRILGKPADAEPENAIKTASQTAKNPRPETDGLHAYGSLEDEDFEQERGCS